MWWCDWLVKQSNGSLLCVVGAWHPALGYVLKRRMLVASISQKQWRNNALSSRCCWEGKCESRFTNQGSPGTIQLSAPSNSWLCCVSFSTVFCFIICCKSFFEWHGRKEQTRLVAQCFKDTQVNRLSSSSGEVRCIQFAQQAALPASASALVLNQCFPDLEISGTVNKQADELSELLESEHPCNPGLHHQARNRALPTFPGSPLSSFQLDRHWNHFLEFLSSLTCASLYSIG